MYDDVYMGLDRMKAEDSKFGEALREELRRSIQQVSESDDEMIQKLIPEIEKALKQGDNRRLDAMNLAFSKTGFYLRVSMLAKRAKNFRYIFLDKTPKYLQRPLRPIKKLSSPLKDKKKKAAATSLAVPAQTNIMIKQNSSRKLLSQSRATNKTNERHVDIASSPTPSDDKSDIKEPIRIIN